LHTVGSLLINVHEYHDSGDTYAVLIDG